MTRPRVNGRVAYLVVSVLVHIALIMGLTLIPIRRPVAPLPLEPEVRPRARVFLPPLSLRERISIGRPSPERARNLLLRREDDLTRPPGPRPQAGSAPEPRRETGPAPPPQEPVRTAEAAPEAATPLRAPATEGPRPATSAAPAGPSLARTLRSLDERLAREGARALEPIVANGMGPLAFDPQGADFTVWVNHWKNETYRNWIIPASVQFGARGVVELGFTVNRAGKVLDVTLLSSSGVAPLDRAAANALLSGRLLPLPDDYRSPELVIRVKFFYNVRPEGS